MRLAWWAAAACMFLVASCSGGVIDSEAETSQADVLQPIATAAAQPAPETTPATTSPPNRNIFTYDGQLTQGGWIRGQAPTGTVTATLGGQALALDDEGYFFAAFDRDAESLASLTARLENGRVIESPISVSPRNWNIEQVNVSRRPRGASEAFMNRRRPELAQINAARKAEAETSGWSQQFIWPVTGRISGRFGSQRIYRGVPGSYHSGIDIAMGGSGTPIVAPADGVVTLATQRPFSLEGYLLIVDHGQGLNSAFLHLSKIAVTEGEEVKQGQYIANIGSSGRATGPHLHWGLKWRKARLDPLLFAGPMP